MLRISSRHFIRIPETPTHPEIPEKMFITFIKRDSKFLGWKLYIHIYIYNLVLYKTEPLSTHVVNIFDISRILIKYKYIHIMYAADRHLCWRRLQFVVKTTE